MRKNKLIPCLLPCLLAASQLFAQESTVYTPAAYGSSSNVGGIIRTWVARKPETNPNNITTGSSVKDFLLTTQYVDGLGRPVQTVVKQGSMITDSTARDLISAQVYDTFALEPRTYLPFASASTNGSFQTNPFQQQQSFYSGSSSPIAGQGETYYYGKTEFEASPFARVRKSFAPGNNWVNGNRGIEQHYWSNMTDDSVRIWTVTDVSGSFGTYSSTRRYDPGTLYKFITLDERSNQTIEFKDKEGKMILKKVQLTSVADTGQGRGHYGWLCTYYIYDAVARLRAVIQPVGVERLLPQNWDLTWNSSVLLNEQVFRYEYDDLGRMIMKKVPGAGALYMVYDKRDRVVLTQDGNLRAGNRWLFTKYDALNRPVSTGFYTNTTYTTLSGMQGYLNTQNMALYENYQTSSWPLYSFNNSFPAVTIDSALTIIYYDDYSWAGSYGDYAAKDNSWDATITAINATSNTTYPYAQPLTQSVQTKGLVTGVWERAGPGLLTANFYDDRSRSLQTKYYNYSGGIDIATAQYNFNGQQLVSVLRHQKGTSGQTATVVTKASYDSLGRAVKIEKKAGHSTINSGTLAANWTTISEVRYDALGRVKEKKLGRKKDGSGNYTSTPVELLAYDYNIRGWLLGANRAYAKSTSSTSNYFGFDLGYDKTTIGSLGSYATAAYNGNVAGMVWRSKGDGQVRKYDFKYDTLNRLLRADFTQYTSGSFNKTANVDFSVKMGDGINPLTAYDGNGNIKWMQQWGLKGSSSIRIDNLQYNYIDHTNRLKNVIDSSNVTNTGLGDFRSSSTYMGILSNNKTLSATDYAYDSNGNLIKDLNKDLGTTSTPGITYNYLNLPATVTVAGKGSIEYMYDCSGIKVKKIVHENGKPDKVTLYLGGFVYQNDTLQFFPQEEGRITYTPATSGVSAKLAYDYFVKDHLGNVRMVLTEGERMDAYPAATLETNNLVNERLLYSKVDDGRVNKSTVTDYPADGTTSPNDYVQQLSASGVKVGAGILLKVMAGDAFNFKVSSWWKSVSSPNSPTSPLTDLVTAMSSSIGGASNKFSTSELSGSSALSSSITSFLNGRDYTSGRPKAYVQWILLDEQLNNITTTDGSNTKGCQQVDASNVFRVHTPVSGPISITQSGYLYIYVSNETPNINVFFDNLQVSHIHGALLEETHYYPFGLTMAGISSSALNFGKENKSKFNDGTELASKEFSDGSGLELYETSFRSYDPQLGRFWQIDPLADITSNWSPYAYVQNNPMRYNDPLGLDTVYQSNKPDWDYSDAGRVWGRTEGSTASYYMYTPWSPYGSQYEGFTYLGQESILPPTVVTPPGSGGGTDFWWLGFPSWQPYTPPVIQPDPGMGGGGNSAWLSTTNNILGYAGPIEAFVGVAQVSMKEYRQSLPLASKIGTFAKFSRMYRGLSAVGGVLGKVGYFGAGVSTIVDYNDMKDGKISEGRFALRTVGTGSSIIGGIAISSVYGGPAGAVGGAVIGGGFYVGETTYDAVNWWIGEVSKGVVSYENMINRGGRSQ